MVSFSELTVLRFMIRYSLKLIFGLWLNLGGFCFAHQKRSLMYFFSLFLNGAVFIL